MFYKNKQRKEIKPKEKNITRTMNYCFFLLNRREYSLKEIRDKLVQYKYHPEDIEQALLSLVENGYQSDRRFAENYIKNKSHKLGRKRLSFYLKNKGIEENLIEELLDELLTEEDKAEKVLLKKFPNLEELKEDKETWAKKTQNKIVRFMLSRGFDFHEFTHLLYD